MTLVLNSFPKGRSKNIFSGLEILKEDELLDLTESEASTTATATSSGLSEISDDLQTKKSKMFKILSLLCVGNADFAD